MRKSIRTVLGCGLAGLLLVVLSACQVGGAGMGNRSPGISASPGGGGLAGGKTLTNVQTRSLEKSQASTGASDIRVFLADSNVRASWQPVHMKPSGVLYVRLDPVIDRRDLIGIQSGIDQNGGGVLTLILSEAGFRKLHDATAAFPGLRLALVVGQTMLAAPGYTAPIRERQIAFSVGSARNAELAARAVAGVH